MSRVLVIGCGGVASVNAVRQMRYLRSCVLQAVQRKNVMHLQKN